MPESSTFCLGSLTAEEHLEYQVYNYQIVLNVTTYARHLLYNYFFLFISAELAFSVATSILQLLNHFGGIHKYVLCIDILLYKLYNK